MIVGRRVLDETENVFDVTTISHALPIGWRKMTLGVCPLDQHRLYGLVVRNCCWWIGILENRAYVAGAELLSTKNSYQDCDLPKLFPQDIADERRDKQVDPFWIFWNTTRIDGLRQPTQEVVPALTWIVQKFRISAHIRFPYHMFILVDGEHAGVEPYRSQ